MKLIIKLIFLLEIIKSLNSTLMDATFSKKIIKSSEE